MKRITWVDFGKGFTIFFVLLAHVFSGIYSTKIYHSYDTFYYYSAWILFMFIMPVFFALSGFLYKSPNNLKTYLSMIYKKGISLIIPYIIFSVIYVTLQHFSKVNHLFPWSSLLNIFINPISYLWFLYALFMVFVIVGLFDILKCPTSLQITLYLLLYIFSQIFELPFFLHGSFSWLIPFYLGNLIKNHLDIFHKKITFYISIMFMILGMIIQRIFSTTWFSSNPMTLINFIPKILTIPVFIYIFINLRKNSGFYKYFEKLGPSSLIIYLVHAPLSSIFRTIYLKLGISNYTILLLLTLISAWEFSIFICYLSKKSRIFQLIFYPYKFLKK